MILAALATLALSTTQVTPIQFVVSEVGTAQHNDSYILPLTDPTHIRLARDKVYYGPGLDKIVVCQIAAGSDGMNRDVKAPGEPLWSWHVTEFLGFAELTAEVMDGWPGLVESNVQGYVQSGIGFWTYSVTEELGAGPSAPPPNAPTNASVGKASGGARVTWQDKSNNEEGFEVERQKSTFGIWSTQALLTLPPNTTTVNDAPGKGTFRYRVRSFTINGSSTWGTTKNIKL